MNKTQERLIKAALDLALALMEGGHIHTEKNILHLRELLEVADNQLVKIQVMENE